MRGFDRRCPLWHDVATQQIEKEKNQNFMCSDDLSHERMPMFELNLLRYRLYNRM